jgi:hypothetical protein
MLLCPWAHCSPRLTTAWASLVQLASPASRPLAAHGALDCSQCTLGAHDAQSLPRSRSSTRGAGLNGAVETIDDEVDGNTISKTQATHHYTHTLMATV